MSVCKCSNPTPAGLLAPDHYGAATWPLVIEGQRLPRKVFRRSIALLSDSLSTLRRMDYSNTTQDSLPVAGQALLDGLSTRKLPMKGFRFVIYISFPSLKLTWRNRCNRTHERDRMMRLLRARFAPLTSSGVAVEIIPLGAWTRPQRARASAMRNSGLDNELIVPLAHAPDVETEIKTTERLGGLLRTYRQAA